MIFHDLSMISIKLQLGDTLAEHEKVDLEILDVSKLEVTCFLVS